MKCLLDMDGVIVDLVQGCCDKVGKPNPYYTLPKCNFAQGVTKTPALLGITPEEWLGTLTEDDWANFRPMHDAHLIVNLLEVTFEPENVCILSNPQGHPSITDRAMVGKLRWLKKHFPQFSDRFLFGPHKEFCANPNHVLIDDFELNVRVFRAHGGKALLLPRLWNKAHYQPTISTLNDFLKDL